MTRSMLLLSYAEQNLSHQRLLADVWALGEAQKTPETFFAGRVLKREKFAADQAKRLIWC